MADQYVFSNATSSTKAQCKVVIYPWVNELDDPNLDDADLAKATSLDISSQIKSCTVTKSMGNAAGTFSFTLSNSPGYGSGDWKDIIRRGVWCVIYMSNSGALSMNKTVSAATVNDLETPYIRCIGYIKRAGVSIKTADNRALDVNFIVSGKDFGIVYEESEIWLNQFAFDSIMLKNIRLTNIKVIADVSVDKAMKSIHDLLMYPLNIAGAKVNDDNSLVSIGLQWLLPTQLCKDIGFTGLSNTYWGNLPVLNIQPTLLNVAISDPAQYIGGNVWQNLKQLSIPHFHELFCELDDNGKPQLTFRPIPWAINKAGYPTLGNDVQFYNQITDIALVKAVHLIESDVAEDDNARYNSFLTTIMSTIYSNQDNISILKDTKWPFHNKASIRRNGFRPMHVEVNTMTNNAQLANGAAKAALLNELNALLYDYWNYAIFAESGTVQKIGSNDVRIGKVMKFDTDVPYLSAKRYYIEGYSDTFQVSDSRQMSWTQEVTLTRGFDESALAGQTPFSQHSTKLGDIGEFTPGDGNS